MPDRGGATVLDDLPEDVVVHQIFYICNPTIREHALLPQPELGKDIYSTVLGLYQHSPTGEYRVLWCSLRDRRKEARLHVLKDVWAVEDYEARIWDLKYRIDVAAMAASRPFVLNWIMKEKKKGTTHPLESTRAIFRGMTVLNDRELLVQFCHEYVSHYDIHGKLVGMANFRKIQYHMELTPHRLQESIVPIPSSGMREDAEPPFSTGHA